MLEQQALLAEAEASTESAERREAVAYRAAAYFLASARAAQGEARADGAALSNDASALSQRPSFRAALAKHGDTFLRDAREGRFDRMGETLLAAREALRRKHGARFATPGYAVAGRLQAMDRAAETLEEIDAADPAPQSPAYLKARYAAEIARERLRRGEAPSWEDNLEILERVGDYFAAEGNALPGANGGRGEELLRAAACAAGHTKEFQTLCEQVNKARGAKRGDKDFVSAEAFAEPYFPEEGTLGAVMEQTAEAAAKEGTFRSRDCRAAFCTYLAAALLARRTGAGLETPFAGENAEAVRQDALRLGQSGALMGMLRDAERDGAKRDALLSGMSAYGELGSGVDHALAERRAEKRRELEKEAELTRTRAEPESPRRDAERTRARI